MDLGVSSVVYKQPAYNSNPPYNIIHRNIQTNGSHVNTKKASFMHTHTHTHTHVPIWQSGEQQAASKQVSGPAQTIFPGWQLPWQTLMMRR